MSRLSNISYWVIYIFFIRALSDPHPLIQWKDGRHVSHIHLHCHTNIQWFYIEKSPEKCSRCSHLENHPPPLFSVIHSLYFVCSLDSRLAGQPYE